MRIKTLLSAGVMALAFSISAPIYAADEVSMHEVYTAAEAGRMADAQAMMDKVLREHPESAKAHYVEAELLAKQGKMSAAAFELNAAERLKPGLPFVKASSVQELKAVIAGHGASRSAAPAKEGGISGTMIFLGLALIVFIFFVGRAMGRRNNPVVYPAGGYNGGNGPYGQAPMGGAPYGGAPMGGGMGSGIMGGLATGAALGAGMVAGEALMHNLTDGGSHHNNGMMSDANASESWDSPNDMGGNDFGVSDSGSWDDSGGGGDWT